MFIVCFGCGVGRRSIASHAYSGTQEQEQLQSETAVFLLLLLVTAFTGLSLSTRRCVCACACVPACVRACVCVGSRVFSSKGFNVLSLRYASFHHGSDRGLKSLPVSWRFRDISDGVRLTL